MPRAMLASQPPGFGPAAGDSIVGSMTTAVPGRDWSQPARSTGADRFTSGAGFA